MKPSPVQLLQSRIDKIAVEVNEAFVDAPDVGGLDEQLTLEVMERIEPAKDFWSVTGRTAPLAGIEGRTYYVSLGVRSKSTEAREQAYQFEIVCSGVVACMPDKLGKMAPDEAAKQYGLSMIYGAMREHFLLITSRMVHGSRLLPTVSFMETPRADVPRDADELPAGSVPKVLVAHDEGQTSH